MRIRALDKNGDWTFGKGNSNYKNNLKALEQNVVTRIKSFKFDWFLDIQANIDWWNILGQKNNEDLIRSQVYRTVVETDGVTKVTLIDLISDRQTRNLTIRLSIQTIYGFTELETTI